MQDFKPKHNKVRSNLVVPDQSKDDLSLMTNNATDIGGLLDFSQKGPELDVKQLFRSDSGPLTQDSLNRNPNAYDPFKGLNHIEMVKVKHDLASSTMLPFNAVDYIQVIANPLDPTQLITVQLFNPAVRLYHTELRQKQIQTDAENIARNYQPRCLRGHNMMPRESPKTDSNVMVKCCICEGEILLGEVLFACDENIINGQLAVEKQQCSYQVCQPCSMKHYKRHNLSTQSSQNHFYTPYELAAVDESNNDDDPLAELSGFVNDENRINALQERVAAIQSSQLKTVTAQPFANIVKEDFSYAEGDNGFKKYVVIGMWRLVDGYYDCYRMFKIESPAFLKIKHIHKQTLFLHSASSQEVMFFTKSADGFSCSFIDLKAAVSGTNFVKLTNLLFKMPTLLTFQFDKSTAIGKLLSQMLLSHEKRLQSQSELQIYNFGKKKVIAIAAPLAYARDTEEFVRTDFANVVFVNLSESKIDLIVYNADLILDVEMIGDQPDKVLFLRDKHIVQIQFAATLSESDESAMFLKQGGIPTMICEQVSYSILPQPKKNFIQLQAELNKEIDLCQSKNSISYGLLHQNRQRVSINYTNGGVFTYGLQKASSTATPFEIFGEIGDMKEVNLTQCTIIEGQINGQGTDLVFGAFKVQGVLQPEKVQWVGHQSKNGVTEQLFLDEFTITDNLVKGSGSDDAGFFSLNGAIDDNRIKFQRVYSTHTIYFQGTISDDRSTIIGNWAYQEGKDFDKLTLQKKRMVEFEMTFRYQDQSFIQLRGHYTASVQVFEGCFSCSEHMMKHLQFDKKHKSRNKFYLRGFECQDKAVLLFSSGDLSDAHFSHIDSKLYVSGNLRLKASESSKSGGYTCVDIDFIDLDQPDLVNKVDKKVLNCLLPESFQEVTDSSGNQKLPDYYLTPFTFSKTNGVYKFAGQMFYYDMMANSRRMIFFHGQEKGHKSAPLVPQWPPIMSDNYTVQYPILAFKTNLPSDNELVIVNTCQNVPQKSINLSPFKFIQFVETGLNPDEQLDPEGLNVNTSIYFLVSLNNCYYLMCYRCFPWPVDKSLIDPLQQSKFSMKDQLHLLSGKIDLQKVKDQIDPQRMMQDKIQIASMLQRVQQDGVQVMVVLQLVDEIVGFNLSKPDSMKRLQENNEKMMTIAMVRGTKEHLYFGEVSETGVSEIVKLSFAEKDKLTKQTIYRCDNARIVAFQIQYNGSQGREDGVIINVLCSDNKLRRLSNSVSQLDDSFSCDKVLDLSLNKAILKLINSLQKCIWQKVTVREKSICAIVQDHQNKMLASVMSPNSELSIKVEPLGFEDDRKFNVMKHGAQKYTALHSEILSTQPLAWIGKNIFEVRDGKNSYFLIQDQYASRRVDLMRIDTESSLREDQKIICNKFVAVKLRHTNQYLLFDQASLFFARTLAERELKCLTPVRNGIQYFASEHSQSKIGQFDQVIRFDSSGNTKEVYNHVIDELSTIKDVFFSSYPIDLDPEWALQLDNEHILGTFAYSYYNELEVVPLQEDQKQLSNGHMEIEVVIVNKDTNNKVDQIIANPQVQNAASILFQSLGVSAMEKLGPKADTIASIFESTEPCPTVFVMRCPNWLKPKTARESRAALFTAEYLVVKHGMFICFALIKDIQKVYEEEARKCNGPQAHTGVGRFKELFEEKRCRVMFNLLNVGVLSSRLTKCDFAIQEACAYEMRIADKGEERKNVVQISFADLAILWDLDENKEVTFLNKPQEFADNEHYIATGFVPYRQYSKKQNLMSQASFFTSNESRSFLITASRQSRPSQLIRTYQYLNLLDVLYIMKCNKKDKFVSVIDLQTMLQNYNDLTFFQIFRANGQYVEYLVDKINSDNIAKQVCIDEAGEVSDNILIRKVYQILNLPVIKEGVNPSAFSQMSRPSLLQTIMYEEENQQLLTPLLQLVMLSREFRLSNLVGNFMCFEKIFDIQSKQIQTFLEEAYFENSQSKTVQSLMWLPNDSMITFGSNHSLLNKEQISKEVRNEQVKEISYLQKLRMYFMKDYDPLEGELKTYPVRVRILEVEWVADKLDQLYYYLGGINDNNLFGNDFIKILLEQQNYTDQLFIKVFIPYIFTMILNLVYFSYFLPSVPVQGGFFGMKGARTQAAIRVLICLCSLFFSGVEVRQLIKSRLSYFADPWNLIFWCTNVLCLTGVIGHGTSTIDLNTLIQIGSVVIVLSWLTLYYWMRLFPELAFYVTMITETLKDIVHFFCMFLMCIAMFANAAYALNQMQIPVEDQIDPPEELWQEAFGVPIIDSFFNQYLIGLGQFYTDPYAASPASTLVQIYFILATLFTQIMFLNMLIAIMGETFGRVSEAKERSALMERTHLYADFMWGITLTEELKGMRYLYVVRPDEDNSENVSQIEVMHKRLTDLIKDNNERNYSEIQNLQDKVHTVLQQHYLMKQEMNAKFDQILQYIQK